MSRFNASAARSNDRDQSNDDWKAELFVNVSLPYKKADGTMGKYKLGRAGLPITSKGNDAKLVELYKKDPEAFQAMLTKNVIIDVQSASGNPVEFAFAL
jgi:hypothetical protein